MSTDDRSEPGRPKTGSHSATPAEGRLRAALDQVARNRPVDDGWASIRSRVTEPAVDGHLLVDDGHGRRRERTPLLAAAAIVVVALIGGGIALANRGDDAKPTTEVSVGAEDDDAPTRGGTIRYAVPSLPTVGFCLPSVEYGADDELVAGAIFEPLTMINGEGTVSPYLAESFTPNADHTAWTITLRPGITFHDGTPLDAAVVRDNLDAYRGMDTDQPSLLNAFRLQDVTGVEVVDDLTVRITTDEPWASLPAVLATPSFGIMAPAQLDGDAERCADEAIGTGPFALGSWDAAAGTARLTRNPDHWQTAPDGQPYPYVDAVELRVETDPAALAEGRVDVMWTDSASLIAGPLAAMEVDGTVERHVAYETSQPAFLSLNHAAAPFDDLDVRRALAMSLDREAIAAAAGLGAVVIADGPFSTGSIGHLDDPGFPSTDPATAAAIVGDYVSSGGSAAFDLLAVEGTDDEAVALAIEEQAEAVGFEVTVTAASQADVVAALIGGGYALDPDVDEYRTLNAAIHRNRPAADPDQLSLWWWGAGSVTNFSRFDDPSVDDLLRQGRSATDPAARAGAYQGVTARFAEQVASVWLWYQPAAVAARPGTGSITGPDLPDGSARATDLSLPHTLMGLTAP